MRTENNKDLAGVCLDTADEAVGITGANEQVVDTVAIDVDRRRRRQRTKLVELVFALDHQIMVAADSEQRTTTVEGIEKVDYAAIVLGEDFKGRRIDVLARGPHRAALTEDNVHTAVLVVVAGSHEQLTDQGGRAETGRTVLTDNYIGILRGVEDFDLTFRDRIVRVVTVVDEHGAERNVGVFTRPAQRIVVKTVVVQVAQREYAATERGIGVAHRSVAVETMLHFGVKADGVRSPQVRRQDVALQAVNRIISCRHARREADCHLIDHCCDGFRAVATAVRRYRTCTRQ